MTPVIAGGSGLAWWNIALLVVVPGLVGGLISATWEYLDLCSESLPEPDDARGVARHEQRKTARRHCLFFLGRSLFGLSGAACVIVGGIWVGKISFADTTENVVLLWALMLVSGLFSRRLVPVIGDQLERELMKRRITDTEKVANHAQLTSSQAMNFTEAISFAQTALSREKTDIDISSAINALKKIQNDFPTHRTLHIYLGRLYRRLRDYDNAIMCLRDFIKRVDAQYGTRTEGAEGNIDIADAYYNIACYHALKAQEISDASGRQTEIDRLKREAVESLQLSIKMNRSNAQLARDDRDFAFLKDAIEGLVGAPASTVKKAS